MARVHAGMTISVDGFVADRDGDVGRLYESAATTDPSYMRSVIAETGAVLMGRRSYDMADDPDSYVGNYEFQVPIFVLTHRPPAVMPKQDDNLTFTFVTDGVESAVAQAREAAGGKVVQALGANVIRQLLLTGLADELHVEVAPVLLGAGLRLFDDPALDGITLEKAGVDEIGAATLLRFRVVPATIKVGSWS